MFEPSKALGRRLFSRGRHGKDRQLVAALLPAVESEVRLLAKWPQYVLGTLCHREHALSGSNGARSRIDPADRHKAALSDPMSRPEREGKVLCRPPPGGCLASPGVRRTAGQDRAGIANARSGAVRCDRDGLSERFSVETYGDLIPSAMVRERSKTDAATRLTLTRCVPRLSLAEPSRVWKAT